MKVFNSEFSKPHEQGWIVLGVIIICLFYVFSFRPYQKGKDFCSGIEYVPAGEGIFGNNTEGYYSTFGEKFKTHDEAMDYCINRAKDLNL